jgi:hypothetical protein
VINCSTRQPEPEVRVAKTLTEVLAAWRLVHDAYVAKGIIDPNPFGLHTNVQTARPGTLVVCGDSAGELSSTLTVTRDGNFGLPLDEVYGAQLDALRSRGAKLCEFGLFTHRLGALPLGMLSATVSHALQEASSTIVIGVHPRHAGFYRRVFGFARLSEAREYETLNGVSVCLLHLDRGFFERADLPSRSVPSDSLLALPGAEQAYGFAPSALEGTLLARYLERRFGPDRPTLTHLIRCPANVSAQPKEQTPP